MIRTAMLSGVLALSSFAVTAHAERDRFTIDNAAYRAECASCHLAYPPQLLPAQSWRALMRALDKHFGSDASVDAKAAADIERYLVANAGRGSASAKPLLRISETVWFKREHDEVNAAVWQRKAVGSAANCGACHVKADQGDYSEDNIRIPK